ncbi:MAG: acyltransferase [candidate division Zixibacteria bacterium]|nr:acyltransferase [candidate division Zixibacteria bacterium]
MGLIQNFLLGVRRQEKWYHKLLYKTALGLRNLHLPFPRTLGAIFFNERNFRLMVWRRLKQFFYYEPMFRYRCRRVGKGLYFESNFPLILGYGAVEVGNQVRISGHVTIIVSYKVNPDPTVVIGDNVYIGFRTILSCGERITIGNRVLMAQGVQIYDNNNHPLDPEARAANEPVEPENIAQVVIEDDVWLGSGAVILRGVTVGRGAVVATSALVSKDVPPMTVVAGNPAKVVKQIKSQNGDTKITTDGEEISGKNGKISIPPSNG